MRNIILLLFTLSLGGAAGASGHGDDCEGALERYAHDQLARTETGVTWYEVLSVDPHSSDDQITDKLNYINLAFLRILSLDPVTTTEERVSLAFARAQVARFRDAVVLSLKTLRARSTQGPRVSRPIDRLETWDSLVAPATSKFKRLNQAQVTEGFTDEILTNVEMSRGEVIAARLELINLLASIGSARTPEGVIGVVPGASTEEMVHTFYFRMLHLERAHWAYAPSPEIDKQLLYASGRLQVARRELGFGPPEALSFPFRGKYMGSKLSLPSPGRGSPDSGGLQHANDN